MSDKYKPNKYAPRQQIPSILGDLPNNGERFILGRGDPNQKTIQITHIATESTIVKDQCDRAKKFNFLTIANAFGHTTLTLDFNTKSDLISFCDKLRKGLSVDQFDSLIDAYISNH